jgi:hypothetical protein
MNKKQKIVLIVAALLMIVVFFTAPVYVPFQGGYVPADSSNESYGRILPSDILIREGLVAAITAIIYFTLKD